ncbi:STAS domain-containing protein [Tautonia plasticadhaerens]|uniref:STAS domain protein n=1 Tax=Tautonia plasticadhaerens TaxID=2527974 RepID=A0A518GY33_9BACT|nr:STAS domain-containing protein [Tautonia plasticadhaerens]QDV33500.1 STAS domain protein [Tautonia plasticadhaerens]
MGVATPEHDAGLYRVVEHGDVVEAAILCRNLPEGLCEALIEQATTRGWSRLMIDCSEVYFLTSLGLGALIRLDRLLRPSGGRLRLFGLKPDLRELFEITRIDRVVQICESREQANSSTW